MTEIQWKTVFAVAAAVCSFLLLQPQVQDITLLAIALGSINVALAVLNPSDRALPPDVPAE